MVFLKNISISILSIIGSMFILTFIMTLFSYFSLISDKLVSIFKIAILFISLFIGGFIMGHFSVRKGWLEGFKLSIIFLIFLIFFEFLFLNKTFEFKSILYYIIVSISCIFGSIIGINFNKVKN